MRKFLPFIVIGLLISIGSFAQQTKTIIGSVTDSAGSPVHDAYIKIVSGKDSITTTTNASGAFRFNKVPFSTFNLTTSIVGYKVYTNNYTVNTKDVTYNIAPIKLAAQDNRLTDVVVVAVNPITIKEDTIEYKANAYKVREGAPVEDVIKKLPGVTVDKDGNVTAQGKQVARVRVNGKDYFGGDVQTATQNLPADVIENIQIIDDYGDRANITGIKEGDPEKILNITIQKGKSKGSFGNATVGAGNLDRYVARLTANNFNGDRQMSVLGSLNNTNANLFNFNGGGRGGGARGANFGSAERGGNGDGITYSRSLGLNFRTKLGEKITTYGSYSFSGNTNDVIGTSFQQNFDPRFLSTTKGSSTSHTNSTNHRLTWNFEYNIDTANYLKVTPYFSYGSSNNSGKSTSEISKAKFFTLNNGINSSNSTSPSGGSELFYNHKFSKRGRNLSLTSSIDYSERTQDRNVNNTYHDVDSTMPNYVVTDSNRVQYIVNESRNTRSNIRVGYAEPIGKYTSIEASYTWNNSSTKSLKNVDDVDPILGAKLKNMQQSNDYDYQFVTKRYGLNLRTFKPKYNYVIGIVAQPSTLTGNDLGRKNTTSTNNFYIVPTARFVYNFARSNNLTITYGGASSEPGFTQLQPVSDSSNLKNIVIGNPDLKPSFTNRLSAQYNKVNILSGNSLFANLSFDQTRNKIVNAIFLAKSGTGRTTTYLNTNGFYSLNGNCAYTKPFADRKFTATVSTSGSFDNNISYTDNLKNHGQNWTIRPGVRFRLDLPDIIDVDVNSNYSLNNTVTQYYDTVDHKSSTQAKTLTFGLNGKNFFFKNWTLGYDLTKVINQGYLNTNNANPTLLNMYVERRFLKNNMATVRFQGFDLFNQNTGISRTSNGSTVTDVQNNRLGRYFLLTLNIRLQKFAGRTFQRNREGRNEDGMRGDGGGFRGGNGGGRFGGGRNN